MPLTEHERREIEAVAEALTGGPAHSDYRGWCARLAVTLRALLPPQETLEDTLGKFLARGLSITAGSRPFDKTIAWHSDEVSDLRAALDRRKKGEA